jgi:Ser/Thr protein kinase RdoA (MazF antagonist)
MTSDLRLARSALEHYALAAPPRRVTLLQRERQSVYMIEADRRGPYVLRLYSGRGPLPARIRSQCQWLSAIRRDTKLIVPEPVANRDGAFVTRFDGASAVLTRWVAGRRRFRRDGPGVGALEKVGRLMAGLHAHGQTFRPPRGFSCPRWDWRGLFGPDSPWRPERPPKMDVATRQLFARVSRQARATMKMLGTGADVFGLIHGDLIQSNYLVDGARVAAIDFADFGRGYFMYDMAVTLLLLKPFDRSGRQRAAFLRGYRSVRPLRAEHERLIDTFIAVRAVVLAKWLIGARRPRSADLRWVTQTLPWVASLRIGEA